MSESALRTLVNAHVKIRTATRVSDEQEAYLRTIPGVRVWKPPHTIVEAPYSMGEILWNILHQDPSLRPLETFHDCMGLRTFTPPPCVPDALWGEGAAENSPVDRQSGIRFTAYQREGIRTLYGAGGGIIEAPAGSGKTVVGDVSALAESYRVQEETGQAGLILTFCNAGAREQQRREKVRFYGRRPGALDVRPFVIKPRNAYRVKDQWDAPEDCEPYVEWCHKNGVIPWIIAPWQAALPFEDIFARLHPCAVVMDEAHNAKGTDRVKWQVIVQEDGSLDFDREERENRAAAAGRLAQQTPARYLTTATPLSNRRVDWWGIASFIEQPRQGHDMQWEGLSATPSRFLIRYCNAGPGEYGGLVTRHPHHSHDEELRARLAHYRYVVPFEWLAEQLPAKRRRLWVVPKEDQDKPQPLTREERSEVARTLKDGTRKNRITEIRLEDAAARSRSATTDLVMEYVTGAVDDGERTTPCGKVLVLDGRIREIEARARALHGRRRDLDIYVVLGSRTYHRHYDAAGKVQETPLSFDEAKDAYMAHRGPCVMIGTYQKLGESHNLQDTDAVVVAMLPYTPAMVAQLEGRGFRLGMQRPLDIVYVKVNGTIHDRLIDIMLDKLPALKAMGGGAHGLDRFDLNLRGVEDVDDTIAGFMEALMAEAREREGAEDEAVPGLDDLD